MQIRTAAPFRVVLGLAVVISWSMLCGASPIAAQVPIVGIGLVVQRSPEGAPIVEVTSGSPAARAGLRVGDVILTVDNTPVHAFAVDAVSAMISGPRGTAVALLVLSGGKGRTVAVVRESAAPAPVAVAPVAPAQSAPANLSFITWTEPRDHSFTIDVPQGWQLSGGLYWKGATNAQAFVRVQSPDGQLQVFFGDPELLLRQVPDRFRNPPGVREGQTFTVPTGDSAILQRFMTGSEYAKQHTLWRQLCRNPQWVREADLPDLSNSIADAIAPEVRAMNGVATASAGEAAFACDNAEGAVTATTVLVRDQRSGMQAWVVYKVAGFVSADPLRSMQARYIMERMLASAKLDPQWEQSFNDMVRRKTGSVIAMQNAAFAAQQGAARGAADALARLNHPNAGVTRSSSPRLANSSGNRDVCDALGRCKNVSDDGAILFIDRNGNTREGRAGGAPPDNTGVWSRLYQR